MERTDKTVPVDGHRCPFSTFHTVNQYIFYIMSSFERIAGRSRCFAVNRIFLLIYDDHETHGLVLPAPFHSLYLSLTSSTRESRKLLAYTKEYIQAVRTRGTRNEM